MTLRECGCVGNRWTCTQVGSFIREPNGALGCPDIDSAAGTTYACIPQNTGQRCPIQPHECPGEIRVPIECTCDGTLWRCDGPPQCHPYPPAPYSVGRRCFDNSACDIGTRCDLDRIYPGVCTARCAPGEPPDAGMPGCGPRVCLADYPGARAGYCAAQCDGRARSCGATAQCATMSPFDPSATRVCVMSCRSDRDCVAPRRCRVRSGRCLLPSADGGASADASAPEAGGLREDGEPCDFAPRDELANPCEGLCVPRGDAGVCTTPVRRDASCPLPNAERISPPGEELDYCLGARDN